MNNSTPSNHLRPRPDAVIITGPTAVGKTDLSLAVARDLDAEIISLDSRPVYRGLDVGTAKPAAEERAAVPHHLIDILEPGERFTVSDFITRSQAAAAAIRARGRLPLFVGGTCMYLNAMLHGYHFADLDMDPAVRQELESRADREGVAGLHAELAGADPESAARIHANDRQRIVRALEVFRSTGQTLSERNRRPAAEPPVAGNYVIVGLCRPREILYKRINNRTQNMYNSNLIEETRAVLERRPDAAAFLGEVIGYAQALRCLKGQCTQQQAAEETASATRAFAKRQITWFRRMRGVIWLNRETISARDGLRLIRSALHY